MHQTIFTWVKDIGGAKHLQIQKNKMWEITSIQNLSKKNTIRQINTYPSSETVGYDNQSYKSVSMINRLIVSSQSAQGLARQEKYKPCQKRKGTESWHKTLKIQKFPWSVIMSFINSEKNPIPGSNTRTFLERQSACWLCSR